jgi:hypothetical protein
MRRALNLLAVGLVSAVLGVFALIGLASAVTTTDTEAAEAALKARAAAEKAGNDAQNPFEPQSYGER